MSKRHVRSHQLLIVAVLTAGAATVPARPVLLAQPAPADNGLIAYSTCAGAIRTIDPASGQDLAFTNGYAPDWSLDGQKMVFGTGFSSGSFTECFGSIGIIDRDGTNRRVLTGPSGPVSGCDPTISPDGTKIAFSRNETPLTRQVWVFDLNQPASATNPRKLTNISPPPAYYMPAWSPKGDRIAMYVVSVNGQVDIVTVDAATGGDERNLTPGDRNANGRDTAIDIDPQWSRDGSTIVFSRNTSGPYNVFTIPAGGGTPAAATAFTGDRDEALYPVFSPSGQEIAFLHRPNGTGNNVLRILTRASAAQQTLTTTAVPCRLAWSRVVTDRLLRFMTEPSNVAVGEPIIPAVEVAVTDAAGNLIPTATDFISIVFETNTTGGSLSGSGPRNAVAGIARFNDLRFEKAGKAVKLRAQTTTATAAISREFDVRDRKLTFKVQPSLTAPGRDIRPVVTVEIQDELGNRLPSATNPIRLTLRQNPALLDTTVTASAGVAEFPNLRIAERGTGYVLEAQTPGIAPILSVPFDIQPSFTVNSVGDGRDTNVNDGTCATVNMVGDVPECTLRAAIEQANRPGERETIRFSIPGGSPAVIAPASPLPPIDDPVVIDATQPGSQSNAIRVVLSGAGGAGGGVGLHFRSGNSTVAGLAIGRFTHGVELSGPGGNRIVGNLIGIDATGTVAEENVVGIRVNPVVGSARNLVGGNVISGNKSAGIVFGGAGGDVANTDVTGNLIGTDRAGTKPVPNGIGVFNDQMSNVDIGGAAPGAGNVISGNTSDGIHFKEAFGRIQANLIGIDAAGTSALGNGGRGVFASSSATIGGDTPAAGNVISGNKLHGVEVGPLTLVRNNLIGTDKDGRKIVGADGKSLGNGKNGVTTSFLATIEDNVIAGNGIHGIETVTSADEGNFIHRNFIGTDRGGTEDLGNGRHGIHLSGSGNNVGGAAKGNTIAFNIEHGIEVAGIFIEPMSTVRGSKPGFRKGNNLQANAIYRNGKLGINLAVDNTVRATPIEPATEVTPNDADDADDGPNDLQNAPAVGSVLMDPTKVVRVRGSFEGRPRTTDDPQPTYRLDFFGTSKDSGPRSAVDGFSNRNGEGPILIGSATVSTLLNGQVVIDVLFPLGSSLVDIGCMLSATATHLGPDGRQSTSEYSNFRQIDEAPDGHHGHPSNALEKKKASDVNKNSVADDTESNVAALPGASGEIVGFVSPAGSTLTEVVPVPSPGAGDPPGASFPHGVFTTNVINLPAADAATRTTLTPARKIDVGSGLEADRSGDTNQPSAGAAPSTMTVVLPAGTVVNSYLNFGPTPDNATPHWYTFGFDGSTGAQIQGTSIVLRFVDGGRGDHDLAANGRIATLGGPAQSQILLSPTSGGTGGGTAVTVSGHGFATGARVEFGSTPAAAVTRIDGERITAVSPPRAAGTVDVSVINPDGLRVTLPAGFTFVSVAAPTADTDGDGLPDAWEVQFGTDPRVADANRDPDGDGVLNSAEFQNGTHPTGSVTQYFAEGATSAFFSTRLALVNPTAHPAAVLLRFLKADGTVIPRFLSLGANTRATVDPKSIAQLAEAEFSTIVESNVPIVSDRTMTWDARGYGSHAETSQPQPSLQWFLAEGATHSNFSLFYLLQNPHATAARVDVQFLRPAPAAPITKTYTVGANSRFNIFVNLADPGLASTDVSAVIRANVPIIVERAMYLDRGGQLFGAGHESAGVTEPKTLWILAEGATGPFFDLFVLIANPDSRAADVSARYLLPDGTVITKTYPVAPNSRFNIWVDLEDPRLADTAVSTTITSTNGVGIIVERAMWWPGTGATWHEAHNTAGATASGTRWALAEGESGGSAANETYVLVANVSDRLGSVQVRLLFEDGTTAERSFLVNANSRFNVAVASAFPEAAGRRFGTVIESVPTGGAVLPAQIVVERAMYSNAGGVIWAAGTNALGTRLQ